MSRAPEAPSNPAGNPLIDLPNLPNGAPPLSSVKPEHYLPAFEEAISESRQALDDIANNRAAPTFDNTIAAMRFSLIGEKKNFGEKFTRTTSVFYNLAVAQADDAFQAVEEKVEVLTTKFVDDVMMDDKLFRRIKAVHDGMETSGLTDEQKAVVAETYKFFARNGALLSGESEGGKLSPKDELRQVNQELARLYATFSNNKKNATKAYTKVIDDEDELKGVPERVKAAYRENAEAAGLKGKWLILLAPPPVDVLEYAENRSLREEIATAMKTIAFGGEFDNRQTVIDIATARHKKAQLLGFDTFADYMLDDKIAKDSATVNDFLEKNLATYRPAAEKFLQKVKDYASKTDGLAADDFRASDFAYYSRRLKEATFSLDVENEVKPYFKLENIVDGLHQHVKKLFNVDVEEAPEGKYPVYDPDVKTYEVRRNGELLGVFYADYFARPGLKKDGAWMEIFRNRGLDENGENLPAIVINCCNFQKPPEGQPALMSMSEATTVFHEFGHALHALLAKGDHQLVTGYRVKQDGVEVPSQLQENWVWEAEVLATFAKHWQTGEVIPQELVKKMRDMENFDAGYAGLRQTFFGLLDMKWHSTDPAKLTSVEAVEDEIGARASLFPRVGAMSTTFGHLFGSDEYAAGYYGYKWAEVLEADIFSAFKKRGIYDAALGAKLDGTIYSQGGLKDFMDLFQALMGRKPDPEALFRREGLSSEPEAANSNTPKPPVRKMG